MPPEKSAYALARYSRSADSVRDSLEWVRGHDSEKFLDSFYFQYGHASIADLGHCIFCFEGISELAAIEIEDEQLWDGQAKSSRYQDFSLGKVVAPAELTGAPPRLFTGKPPASCSTPILLSMRPCAAISLKTLPRPDGMKAGAYRRTIDARAYDVARYLLFTGISTNIGQVTSIRTLEKQMRKLGVSEYGEVRDIAREMHDACAAPPGPASGDEPQAREPVAPTLAKYAEPDAAAGRGLRARLRLGARELRSGGIRAAPRRRSRPPPAARSTKRLRVGSTRSPSTPFGRFSMRSAAGAAVSGWRCSTLPWRAARGVMNWRRRSAAATATFSTS